MSIGTPANISYVDTTEATTASWGVAYSSNGPGRHLFICTSARQPTGLSDRLCSAVTYNADAASPYEQDNGTSIAVAAGTLELWSLKNPDEGADLVLARLFNKPPNAGDASSVVFELTGVHDDVVGATVVSSAEDTSAPSVSITTTTPNSMVVALFGRNVTGGISFAAGSEPIYDDGSVNRLAASLAVAYKLTTTVGEYTLGITGSGATNDWTMLAVEILPAGAVDISPLTGALHFGGGLGDIRLTRRIGPVTGALALAGGQGVIRLTRRIGPLTGGLRFDGGAVEVELFFDIDIAPETGTLSLVGGEVPHSVFTWDPVPESDTLWTQAV